MEKLKIKIENKMSCGNFVKTEKMSGEVIGWELDVVYGYLKEAFYKKIE